MGIGKNKQGQTDLQTYWQTGSQTNPRRRMFYVWVRTGGEGDWFLGAYIGIKKKQSDDKIRFA